MSAHEFIDYDLNNPRYLLRKSILGVLDERDVVDYVQIADVV